MIGADAIVKCLEAEGVEYVFGYPGVAICPFYNSILDSGIRTILIRTEQNAAHAASGQAGGLRSYFRARGNQCDYWHCYSFCRQYPVGVHYRAGKQ